MTRTLRFVSVFSRSAVISLVWLLLLVPLVRAEEPPPRAATTKTHLQPTRDPHSPTGFYIPRDLTDALAELDRMLPADVRDRLAQSKEDGLADYHMSLGMWLRNNWGLWQEQPLARWFRGLGISHPDDMSGILLNCYWRHLNHRPVQLEEQVKHYQDYWKRTAAACRGNGQPASAQ